MAGTPASSRGAAAVTTRELLSSSAGLAIAGGDSALLTWAKDGGDTLLDVSTPAQPTIITAGVYAFAVTVRVTTALTVGTSFRARLALDTGGNTANAWATGDATAVMFDPDVAMSCVSYLPVAAEVNMFVSNYDSGFVSFGIHWAVVQRLA